MRAARGGMFLWLAPNVKHAGLHWTVRAQLARRGGLKVTRVLDGKADGGFIQSLRATNMENEHTRKNGANIPGTTGGYNFESSDRDLPFDTIPSPLFWRLAQLMCILSWISVPRKKRDY